MSYDIEAEYTEFMERIKTTLNVKLDESCLAKLEQDDEDDDGDGE